MKNFWFRRDDEAPAASKMSNEPADRERRDWLSFACIACVATSALAGSEHAHASLSLDTDTSLFNPCKSPLPDRLRTHELVARAWDGIDATKYWDSHVHLLGVGDGDTGCWINPRMRSLLSPKLYLQKRFFLNAACVGKESEKAKTVDADYVTRLKQLVDEMPVGAKLMLFAFDRTYPATSMSATGFDLKKSAFYVPNEYAAKLAKQYPDRFQFVASVHPYRDAPEKMDEIIGKVATDGAVAIKWLPAAMGIDPASPRCDAMYAACNKYGLPIITHAGEERAVEGAHVQHYGNPLRLRRPLDQGVKIVVAHCASMGTDVDLDVGEKGPRVPSFKLFERLMNDKKYDANLFADISAIPQANRADTLAEIVGREAWTTRLVNGSDYPLPGVMPLFSVDKLVERGWLPKNEGDVIKSIREYNPLVFDFVLKRSLRIQGKALDKTIFESARVFAKRA
jgi:uncharacterized protein